MRVKVYAARIPQQTDHLPLDAWLAALPSPRRQRMEHLRFREDRLRGALADRLLRLGLNEAGLDASLAGWREDAGGKPSLNDLPNVHFSLSHSGNLVLCALADAPVGTDVERVRPLPLGVAQRVLSPVELNHYTGSGCEAGLIIRLWTLKESYAKYTGQGLGAKFSEISFPTGAPPANLPDVAFALLDVGADYRGAVCSGKPMVISVKWVDIDQL